MDSEDDIHFCLRCNTEIVGLMAYVEHRKSKCSESDNLDSEKKDATKNEKASKGKPGEGDYLLIDEEEENLLEQGADDPESSVKVAVESARGRKRKQGSPKPSQKLGSEEPLIKKSTRQNASSPEELVLELVCEEDDGSPGVSTQRRIDDSPRRSGRRGIRISYTDLLSGVDRTEAKMIGEGASPRRRSEGGKDKGSPTKRVGRPPKNAQLGKNEGSVRQNSAKNKTNAKEVKETRGKVTLGQKVKLRAAEAAAQKTEKKIKVIKKEKVSVSHKKKTNKKPQTGEREEIANESDEIDASSEEGLAEDVQDVQSDNTSVVFIKDGKFYCHKCQVYCPSKKKMDVHCTTRKHVNKVELVPTEAYEELEYTEQEEEDETEMLRCHDCAYVTKNQGQFDRHMRSISHAGRANITLFPCKQCHRKYKSEEELEDHQIFHEVPRCTMCKETFETEELLGEHLEETNHTNGHQCPKCNKTFSTKGNLSSHMRNHDPERMLSCDQCEYSCFQVALMKRHKNRHLGIKPFKCGLCEFESPSRHSMERHMKTHLNRSRDFKCDECGSGFFDENLLKQHQYMKHSSERRFPCEFEGCTFAFKYRSSLITHQRMHTQEKPYLCAECGYAASTKYSLTKHIRLHTGEKPFKCNFPNCQYSCRLSTHLSRHKIIHTGAKPFQCPFCSYACNNKQNLRKHLLTTKAHTGVKMYECKSCPNYSTNDFRDYVIHIRKEHADDEKYISYFEIAESVNKKAENMARALASKQSEDAAAAEGVENEMMSDDGLQSFSVLTVVPGKEGSGRLRNVTIMDDRAEVQKKLEQVILALEDTTAEVAANQAGEESGDSSNASQQIETSETIQVSNLGDLVSLAAKELSLGDEAETIYIVPDVQTETEISTSEGAPGAVATTAGEATTAEGEGIQQIVVEFDQQGRLVSEEEMAAATWLHNMGNVHGVTVEAIIEEEPAAEEVHE